MRFSPGAAIADQTRAPQQSEVFRDCRLRDAKAVGECMHRLLAIAGQALKDGAAGWIGKGLEDVGCDSWHAQTITEWLWFVKDFYLARVRRKLPCSIHGPV
jgi:hypothetical protein